MTSSRPGEPTTALTDLSDSPFGLQLGQLMVMGGLIASPCGQRQRQLECNWQKYTELRTVTDDIPTHVGRTLLLGISVPGPGTVPQTLQPAMMMVPRPTRIL